MAKTALVHLVQNKTVVLKLPNDNLVSTYPVTCLAANNRRSGVSFCPCVHDNDLQSTGTNLAFGSNMVHSRKNHPSGSYQPLSSSIFATRDAEYRWKGILRYKKEYGIYLQLVSAVNPVTTEVR